MRIGQSFALTGIASRRVAAPAASDSGFATRIGGGAAQGPTATTGLTPLTSLGAVLAVQEIDDPLTGRRRARQRGEQLLDALDDVQLALLNDGLSLSTLVALQRLVAEQDERAGDPALQAVLDAIDLKAAVELAKLERQGE